MFVFFFCSHWSLVDVPLISFCSADHVPDWHSRILLGIGGGDSFLFIYFIFFTCIGFPIYVGYFVCDLASEFGAMGSTSFFGVFLP